MEMLRKVGRGERRGREDFGYELALLGHCCCFPGRGELFIEGQKEEHSDWFLKVLGILVQSGSVGLKIDPLLTCDLGEIPHVENIGKGCYFTRIRYSYAC